jgi:RNA polymerase sigma factor (sigma-70 family)
MSTRTPRAHDPESPTSLDLYLREIGEYPLLTSAQERALGRQARAGDAAAAEALVTCNLRFTVMIAKRYQHLGLPLADLIHEGNVGMVHAATKFDPDIGARFVSYASWWVRQAIHRALDRAVTVRPKGANQEKLRRIRKHAARLAQLYAREPTLTELAGAAGVEVVEAAQALNLTGARRAGIGDDLLLERLPHADQPLPDEEAYVSERAERIETVLGTLREREALVLRQYYGLNGCVAMTQAEIAEALGISPQRVQQLLVQGLNRLKEPTRRCRLEPYR